MSQYKFTYISLVFLLILIKNCYSCDDPAIVNNTNITRSLQRGKRFLDFIPTTRMFYRVNCKNNIIPRPTIWANGYGFRMNIPIENDKKFRPFRRDTYTMLHDLMEKIGFSGEACVLKVFCLAHAKEEEFLHSQRGQEGMLMKLLKYIFTLDAHEKRHFPYLRMENCEQILHSHCPLSFDNISPYTDDV